MLTESSAADGKRLSEELLERLSVHPDAETDSGTLHSYGRQDTLTSDRIKKLE